MIKDPDKSAGKSIALMIGGIGGNASLLIEIENLAKINLKNIQGLQLAEGIQGANNTAAASSLKSKLEIITNHSQETREAIPGVTEPSQEPIPSPQPSSSDAARQTEEKERQ